MRNTFRVLMKFYYLVAIIFYCQTSTAQDRPNADTTLIITESQNLNWLKYIDSLELTQRIEKTIERLYLDTNIYVRPSGDIIKTESTFKLDKIDGCCRPLFIVNGKLIDFRYDKTNFSYNNYKLKLRQFISLLEKSNIFELTVWKNESHAIFGEFGKDGALVLTLKGKKSKKLLKSFVSTYQKL